MLNEEINMWYQLEKDFRIALEVRLVKITIEKWSFRSSQWMKALFFLIFTFISYTEVFLKLVLNFFLSIN